MATVTSLGFSVTSRWDGTGIDKARKDIEKLRAELAALGKSKIRVGVEIDNQLKGKQFQSELDKIGRGHKIPVQVDIDAANARAQIIALNAEAKTAGVERARIAAAAAKAQINEESKMRIQAMETQNKIAVASARARIAAEARAAGIASKAAATREIKVKVEGDGLGKLILMNITIRAAIIASLALTATFLGLGSAAALVGAAITLGIGGGMIAAAAFALKSNEQIISAFERLKTTAQTAFAGVADSMIGPLVDAMGLLEEALVRIAPLIRRAFESTVPLVRPLTEGVVALVENTLPGFLTLMERMVPVAEGARRGFANFGTGLSQMFEGLSLGTEGFGKAIDITFAQVGRFLAILGDGFGRLADDGSIALGGLLEGINGLVKGLLDGMKPAMDVMAVPLANFTRALGTDLGDSLRTILPALGRVAAVVFDILAPAMDRILPPLSTVVAKMLDGLLPALESAKPWIDHFVDGIVAVLEWITPFADKLGLAAAGIWLVNAALSANPIVLVIGGLILLVGYLVDLEQRTHALSETWANIWPKLEPFVTPVKDVIAELRDVVADLFGQTPDVGPITGQIHSLGDAAWEEQPKVENFGTTLRNTFGPDVVVTIANFRVGWDQAVANVRDGLLQMMPDLVTFALQFRHVFDIVGDSKTLFVQFGDIIWDTFNGTIRPAFDGITQVVQGAMTMFGGVLRLAMGDLDGLKNTVLGMWTAITGAFSNSAQVVVNITNNAMRLLLAPWQWLYDTLVGHSIVPDLMARIEELFMLLPNKVVGVVTGFCDTVKGAFEGLKNGVVGTVQALSDKIGEIWSGIREKFAAPVNFVIKVWNEHVGGKFGLPMMDEIAIPGKAYGGPITGMGGPREDNIPIWASAGEHMLTADEVDAAGGHAAIYALRSQLRTRKGDRSRDNTFADGGEVRLNQAVSMAREKGDGRAYVYGGSGPDGFDCSGYMSAIFNTLAGAANQWARSFTTESDFGSLGFAPGLGGKFSIGVHRGGGGPLSHMAGTLNGVNVESGGAHNSTMYGGPAQGADSPNFELQFHMPEFGGNFVTGGAGGGGVFGMVRNAISSLFTRLTDPLVNAVADPMAPMSKPLGSLPRAAVSKMRDAFADKLRGAEGASGSLGDPGGSIPDGDRLDIINKALALTNTPPPDSVEAWQRGLNTLITRESSWNPNAHNMGDSNASVGGSIGLMQTIPSTFASNAAPGHGDIRNPVDNVAAGINYIKGRYGSITAVQQANANMSHKGYGDGTVSADSGWNLVGENGPEAVQFRGGEPVKSFDDIVTALRDPNSETSQKALGAMREFGKANAEQFMSDLTGGGMGDGFIPQLFKQGGEYGAKVVEEHIHYHVSDMDEAIKKENQRRKEQALGF